MAKPEDFPEVSEALLLKLKEMFPDRLPRHQVTDYDIAVLQGQQKVIDFLTLKFKDQLTPKGQR